MIQMPTDAEPVTVIEGDCLEGMAQLPDGCVQCCVTSPPYFGLRDYGHAGQVGLEPTPVEYVAKMAAVFREVRRVLADDGTLWLNLGDSYNAYNGNRGKSTSFQSSTDEACPVLPKGHGLTAKDAKPKDLLGIPWRVAFALQDDGWYLRQDIIWAKPNPMPESVRDRCTKSHEYLFLLSKSSRYYFDAAAIAERSISTQPAGNKVSATRGRIGGGGGWDKNPNPTASVPEFRNRRSVWNVAPEPFEGAHFAVMPTKLVEPCVLAGSRKGDVVLDPFLGSGTVADVAVSNWRRAIGCELNPTYATLARERVAEAMGRGKGSLFCGGGVTHACRVSALPPVSCDRGSGAVQVLPPAAPRSVPAAPGDTTQGRAD